MGDRGRLSQAVANLIANAIKYTDRAGHLTIQVTQRTGKGLLVVSDTGTGIEGRLTSRPAAAGWCAPLAGL